MVSIGASTIGAYPTGVGGAVLANVSQTGFLFKAIGVSAVASVGALADHVEVDLHVALVGKALVKHVVRAGRDAHLVFIGGVVGFFYEPQFFIPPPFLCFQFVHHHGKLRIQVFQHDLELLSTSLLSADALLAVVSLLAQLVHPELAHVPVPGLELQVLLELVQGLRVEVLPEDLVLQLVDLSRIGQVSEQFVEVVRVIMLGT